MFLNGTSAATEKSGLDLFLDQGLSTLLIGMLVVFAILGIIFVALTIMRAIFKRDAIKAKKARKAEEVSAQAEEAAAIAIEAEETAPATDDSAIVAAIVAAISAYTGKAPEGFRVVSFKKRK